MIKKQSVSGVSIAIKNTMHSYQNSSPLVEKCKPKEFTIKIANTLMIQTLPLSS